MGQTLIGLLAIQLPAVNAIRVDLTIRIRRRNTEGRWTTNPFITPDQRHAISSDPPPGALPSTECPAMRLRKRARTCAVGILASLALTACGGADGPSTPPDPGVNVSQVRVSGPASLDEGQTVTLQATAMTAAGTVVAAATFTWTSSDPTIATVAGGRVVGVKAGNATIAATSGSASGSIAIVVKPVPVGSITIVPATPTLTVGQSVQLSAVTKDSSGGTLAGRTVSWTSSNVAVATVSATGLVAAIAPGTVTITAASEGKAATAALTVEPAAPIASINITLPADRIIAGAKTEIASATMVDSAGQVLPGRSASWSSDQPSIATVDAGGRINAISAGAVRITAASAGKTASVALTIEPRSQYESIASSNWDFLLTANDARSPVWNDARQGWMPRSTDSREQIVIDETFTVAAGQQIQWDNKIVWIRPKARRNIAILGTLAIHNSLILWDQTEHQQCRFDVQRGGSLIIQNSYAFSSNQFWVNWDYDDGATVSFDHFQGHIWTEITGGAVQYTSVNASTVWMSLWAGMRNSAVAVSDASSLYFELLLPAGTFSLGLPRKLVWQDWTLPLIWSGSSVVATNSFVVDRDVTLNNGTNATVTDASDGFSLGWGVSGSTGPYINCELRDLGNPADSNGVLYAAKTWSLPCTNASLTIKNSRIMRAWPFTNGNVHLKVYNSYLVDTRNYGNGATYEVYDSNIELLSATSGGRMYIENSTLRQDIEVNGPGSTIYSYGLRTASSSPPAVYQESGGKYLVLALPGPPW